MNKDDEVVKGKRNRHSNIRKQLGTDSPNWPNDSLSMKTGINSALMLVWQGDIVKNDSLRRFVCSCSCFIKQASIFASILVTRRIVCLRISSPSPQGLRLSEAAVGIQDIPTDLECNFITFSTLVPVDAHQPASIRGHLAGRPRNLGFIFDSTCGFRVFRPRCDPGDPCPDAITMVVIYAGWFLSRRVRKKSLLS